MTTIAVRDGVIAADTLVTYNGNGHMMKGLKLFLAGRFAVGIAGEIRYKTPIKNWLESPPENDSEVPRLWDDEWNAILMDAQGKAYVLLADAIQIIEFPYFSIGSGSDIALGAMAMGASAREAIEIASRFDNCTNGLVESISTEDLQTYLKK